MTSTSRTPGCSPWTWCVSCWRARGDVVVAVAPYQPLVAVLRRAGGVDRNGSVRAIERACFKVEGSNPEERRGERPAPGSRRLRLCERWRRRLRATEPRQEIIQAEIAALYPALALAPRGRRGGAAGGCRGAAVDPDHQLVALDWRVSRPDPQVLVDVFANYDCDLNGENLFEATIGVLAGAMTPGKGPRRRFATERCSACWRWCSRSASGTRAGRAG